MRTARGTWARTSSTAAGIDSTTSRAEQKQYASSVGHGDARVGLGRGVDVALARLLDGERLAAGIDDAMQRGREHVGQAHGVGQQLAADLGLFARGDHRGRAAPNVGVVHQRTEPSLVPHRPELVAGRHPGHASRRRSSSPAARVSPSQVRRCRAIDGLRQIWLGLLITGAVACGRTEFGPGALGLEPEPDDLLVGPGGRRCENVDMLFVIDDSKSMLDAQMQLIRDHGALVDGTWDRLEQLRSLRVGVTTAGANLHNNSHCRDIGGLVVETGAKHSSHRACGPYGTFHNYMEGPADVAASFPCAAQVGAELVNSGTAVDAAVAAVTFPLVNTGNCNEGFGRVDALVVVVFVTNRDIRDDALSAFIKLAEAKAHRERNLVVVTIAEPPDADCPHSRVGHRLIDMTETFTHHVVAPVCAPSYVEAFEEAVDVIEGACETW